MEWDVHRATRVATEALAVGMLSFSLQAALRAGYFGWASRLVFQEALLVSAVLLLAWLGVMARQDLLVWLAGGFLVFESAVTWMGLGRRLLVPALLMLGLYAIAALTRPAEAAPSENVRRGVPIAARRPPTPRRGGLLELSVPTVPLRAGRRRRAFVPPRTHPQGVPPSVRRALAQQRRTVA